MAAFELSNQVSTGKRQAEQLSTNLKTLHQTLKDTDIDATILQDLNLCVAKAQKLSTETFLFFEKEAEKYVSPSASSFLSTRPSIVQGKKLTWN
jgi:hypothetical protein